jgi:universal stress protein E
MTSIPVSAGPISRRQSEDYRRKLLNDAERSLHEQLSQTDYRTLKYGVKLHVVEGPPDERILEAVDEHAIDLLVMGTAARSGVSRLVVGNTAERVLARVSCSVLAVKPKGFVSSVTVD